MGVNSNTNTNSNETTNHEAQAAATDDPLNERDYIEAVHNAPAPDFASMADECPVATTRHHAGRRCALINSKRNRTKRKGQDAARNLDCAPLLVKTQDACKELGGIHPRSLARLEKRGLIRSVKLLRHKLYAMDDLKALVEDLRGWTADKEVSND